jgi:peptidyl-prolyl cis-trans isomerase D
MLAFFRRIINSRVGVVVTLGVLILIALAFVVGDVTTAGGGFNFGGGSVAKVGGDAITPTQLRDETRSQFEQARAQAPQLDLATFVSEGGFDATLQRLINERAIDAFGNEVGMRVGKQLVDGQLLSFPALQGPDGKFNQQLYDSILRQRRMTDAAARADIARGILAQHLMLPTGGATQMPMQLALPYANSELEKRAGQVGFVPTAAMKVPAPNDGDIQSWYKRNLARYSLPQRRVLRYALVTPASVADRAKPTDAEIAQAYAQQRQKYLPTEKRTISQVVVLTEAAANALAAKVKGGTSVADAARAAGLEARTLTGVEKTAYAAQSSAAAADAAFAASKGGVIGPVRGSLGFVIAKIDAIEQVPGRTLAQAQGEIATTLAKQKTQAAMADIQDKLGGAFDRNATFAEAVAEQKLSAQVTPAVTAQGINPDQPAAKPDPALTQIVQAGFAMSEGDDPSVVQTAADGSFAVVGLDRIVPAAPRPLAAVREQVVRDVTADRAKQAARALADRLVAAGSRGSSLAHAFAGAGVALPGVKPLGAVRAQLGRAQGGVPPALALLFSMAPGSVKRLEAPNDTGWYVIRLDTVTPGDVRQQPQLATAVQRAIARDLGREYVQQFTNAIRREVGVKRNDGAVAEVRNSLARGGATDQ